MAIAVVLYVIFCLLAGLAGSQRRMGFFGTFLLSLVITPLLASLLLIFTRPARERDRLNPAAPSGVPPQVTEDMATAIDPDAALKVE